MIYPKISIITVCLNVANSLEKTILSISSQTYPNIEFIVVDGGSSDGTLDVLKKYDNVIDKWVSEPDNGIYDAMNKGVNMASGEWLNFMNADDIFESVSVVKEMSSEFDGYQIVYGNMIRKSNRKHYLSRGAHGIKLDAFDFMHSSLCHQAAFIKKDLFDKYGGYSLNYSLASDSEFFFRLIVQNGVKYKYIDKTVAIFSLGGASSQRKSLYDAERKDFLIKAIGHDTYNRYEELYLFKNNKLAVASVWLKQCLKSIKHIIIK